MTWSPGPALAAPFGHVKWFVDDLERFDGVNVDFLTDPVTITLLAMAVVGAVLWRVIADRLPEPELGVLTALGRLAPYIPRLLGVHLGVSLLSLAVTNAYLAPHLTLDPVPGGWAIATAEGIVGVWLVTGVALRAAAICVVLLGPAGLVLAGLVPVLEAMDLLGVALFLALIPPGPDRWGYRRVDRERLRAALWVLRVCLGTALIVVAFSEKLAAPDISAEFLTRYPALNIFQGLGLELGADDFIRFAAAVEILFGLLIISGASPQAVVLVAGVPFNATLFFLDRSELIGHLPIYGAMLALLVYGSNRATADVVPSLLPFRRGLRRGSPAGDVRAPAGRSTATHAAP